ncbi:Chromosomal replication initiator protein DnaA [Frankliniella fusca]|uniref:Chromosomal replication initiator protein DnaA n=1 Tax=Frankliniella fusca TaxID=407009 RepID=A0AAE1H6L5_9NEOP|nr:Chromosomal replication initiator protein DnaA [Frankliniella fusca]
MKACQNIHKSEKIEDNFITWIHILRPDPPHAVPCEHLLLALPSKIRVSLSTSRTQDTLI